MTKQERLNEVLEAFNQPIPTDEIIACLLAKNIGRIGVYGRI